MSKMISPGGFFVCLFVVVVVVVLVFLGFFEILIFWTVRVVKAQKIAQNEK